MNSIFTFYDRRPARPAPKFLEAGFVLPTAIFLIVILALLATFLVRMSLITQRNSVLDVQGERAYQAARAGIELGLYQTLRSPIATPPAPTLDSNWGWANANLPCANSSVNLDGFAVTLTCAAGTAAWENNVDRFIKTYRLSATASPQGTAVASLNYTERQIFTSFSVCRSQSGQAPRYECP